MIADDWLEARTAGAPAALRHRVRQYAAGCEGPPEEALGRAGIAALKAALAEPADRSAALDLLAADALVTLALQAAAERHPAGLADLARRLRRAGAGMR